VLTLNYQKFMSNISEYFNYLTDDTLNSVFECDIKTDFQKSGHNCKYCFKAASNKQLL